MTSLHTTMRDPFALECRGFAIFAQALRRTWPIALLLFTLSTAATAQELGAEDQINVGIAKSSSPQVRRNAEAEKALKVEPTRTFEFMWLMASQCVIVPSATAGTIHLRSDPEPSEDLVVLLCFNFADGS